MARRGTRRLRYRLPLLTASGTLVASGALALAGGVGAPAGAAEHARLAPHTSGVTWYQVPGTLANGLVQSIALDPSSSDAYFVVNGEIGKLSNGTVTLIALPSGQTGLTSLAFGPDGNLWGTDAQGFFKFVTTTQAFSTFAISGLTGNIVNGPVSWLWATTTTGLEWAATSGFTTAVPISGHTLGPLAAPTDGFIWSTDAAHNQLVRVSSTGAVTIYGLPVEGNWGPISSSGPLVHFLDIGGYKIDTMDSSSPGTITNVPIPTSIGTLGAIASNAAGTTAVSGAGGLGVRSAAGVFTFFTGLTNTPDDALALDGSGNLFVGSDGFIGVLTQSTVQPSMALSVQYGPPGTSVLVTGAGLAPSSAATIVVSQGTTTLLSQPVTTNSSGGFSHAVTVPKNLKAGTVTFQLEVSGTAVAHKSFDASAGWSQAGADAQSTNAQPYGFNLSLAALQLGLASKSVAQANPMPATPVVWDADVFTMAGSALIARSRSTLHTLWSASLPVAGVGSPAVLAPLSGSGVQNGLLAVADGKQLVVFAAEGCGSATCTPVSQIDLGSTAVGSPALFDVDLGAGPVPTAVVPTTADAIVLVDLVNGTIERKIPVPSASSHPASGLVVTSALTGQPTVLQVTSVFSSTKHTYAYTLRAYVPGSQSAPLWSDSLGISASTLGPKPLVDPATNDTYVMDASGHLRAFAGGTGAQMWARSVGTSPGYLAIGGGTTRVVYGLSGNGAVSATSASTGKDAWAATTTVSAGTPTKGVDSIAFSNGVIYTASGSKLSWFSAGKPTTHGAITLGHPITGLSIADGRINLATTGTVYSLSPK